MTVAFDPSALPQAVRMLVERALREGWGHEVAIAAIEAHLADGGERTPDVLVALATLTYDDAAAVVLHRLRAASKEAIALIDEAVERGGSAQGLLPLRGAFEAARLREEARDAQVRMRLVELDRTTPAQLAELAHRLLMDGDDGAARALMDEAARRAPADEDEELEMRARAS